MQISLDSQDTNIYHYVEKYQVWHDWQVSAHNSRPSQSSFDRPLLVNGTQGYPCFQKDDIAGIRSCGSDIVFVDNITESINCKELFEQYPVGKKYVIFSNGSWQRDRYPLPIDYVNITHHFYLLDFSVRHFDPYKMPFYFDKDYVYEPKPMLFVSTTGSRRTERDVFIQRLLDRVPYSNFVLRYSGEDLGRPARDCINFGKDGFDSYTALPGLEKYFLDVSQTVPIEIYNQGYFNLLLEGDIDWPGQINVSEKTAKCLITGMPFVMVSSPGFLAYLRTLGFQTYDSLWDESYDSIEDYSQRMDRIVDLCGDLGRFDWAGRQGDLQEISLHNRANFSRILAALTAREFASMETEISRFLA